MTREEVIEMLKILKEQARNSGANTFVWDIKIDSFNFVIDMAIKALEQESILDKIRAEILEEHENAYAREDYDTAYGLGIALDITDKYKAESEGKE